MSEIEAELLRRLKTDIEDSARARLAHLRCPVHGSDTQLVVHCALAESGGHKLRVSGCCPEFEALAEKFLHG